MEQVAPMIRRVVANNPSPFTFYGTGTYIVGEGEVAVIDPGPDNNLHIGAIVDALGEETVSHILVTHTHLDHSAGCPLLQAATGAPSCGYGAHGSGRLLRHETVEEGADKDFRPDIHVKHGDVIEGNGWSVQCVHTPGHTSNHMCYQLRRQRALFCGDHIMAWSTSIISPPDGNLADYLASLDLLLRRDDERYWPCHGPCVDDPKPFVQSYIDHRHRRLDQIVSCLRQGTHRIGDMLPSMYSDLPKAMYPAAARSVLSSLMYLIDQDRVTADNLGLDGEYRLN